MVYFAKNKKIHKKTKGIKWCIFFGAVFLSILLVAGRTSNNNAQSRKDNTHIYTVAADVQNRGENKEIKYICAGVSAGNTGVQLPDKATVIISEKAASIQDEINSLEKSLSMIFSK